MQKYGQLKRNFDSVSLHAKKDAETNEKVAKMREEYETQISQLTTAKQTAETEVKEYKTQLTTSEARNKEQALKLSQQNKEIETLKKDLARLQKGLDSQLQQAQKNASNLYEEKNRLLIEVRKLKDELKESNEGRSMLEDQLAEAADSVR